MGQKQRKDAEVKGTLPNTAVQSDNSKAPENAIGEVMEHSQKNAEPRTGALRMEPHEREEQILKIAAEHFARRGVLGAGTLLRYVAWAGANDIVLDSSGVFNPTVPTTRAELARFIRRYKLQNLLFTDFSYVS